MNKIADALTYNTALHKLLVAFNVGKVWHMRREAWPVDDACELRVDDGARFLDYGYTSGKSRPAGPICAVLAGNTEPSSADVHERDWCIYAPADDELSQPYDPIAQRNRIGNAIVAAVEKRGFKASSVENETDESVNDCFCAEFGGVNTHGLPRVLVGNDDIAFNPRARVWNRYRTPLEAVDAIVKALSGEMQ